MNKSGRLNLLKKLKRGTRYLYLAAEIGVYLGKMTRAYTGIYAGMDDSNNVIFTDVEFYHPPHSRIAHCPHDGTTAKIPLERILKRENFFPINPKTGEPIEVDSIENLLNYMKHRNSEI